MSNLRVNEANNESPNNDQEKHPERSVRSWRLFAGLLLLLIIAGLFVFRWRLSEPTQAMETAPAAELLLANSTTKTVAHNTNALPLSVTVLDMDPESGVLEVEVAGEGRPFSIQTADSTLLDAEGRMFEGRCAMLHKELTITEGDWLEVGQELQARQLIVSGSSPSISLPAETQNAPPDTLAYLAEPRFRERVSGDFASFMALSEDGTITHLTTLPPLISSAWPYKSTVPWPARFLLTLRVPNCEQAWLFMYDPQQGIVERWLTSYSESYAFPGVGFVWRPLEEHFILTGPIRIENRQNSDDYYSYWSAGPDKPLHLLGELSNSLHLLGWSSDKAVTFDGRVKNNMISLIDLTSGKASKSIPLAGGSLSLSLLSKDGTRFFYTDESPPTARTFNMLDIEKSQKMPLFSLLDGELIRPITYRTSTDHLLLWRELRRSDASISRDLRLVDLNASSEPTIVMEILPNEYVTSALLCEGGRVLISVYNGLQSEVRMWQPDGSISTLLKQRKQLDVLSCR